MFCISPKTLFLSLISISCFFLFACSADKNEAKQFSVALIKQNPTLEVLNSKEKEIMVSLTEWSGRMASLGPLTRDDYHVGERILPDIENLQVGLDGVLRTVEDVPLKTAYLQAARSDIVETLKKRIQYLNGLTGPLASANGHIAGLLRGIDSYNYGEMGRINVGAKTYVPAENNLNKVLTEIRTKYDLTDGDLR